MGDKVTLEFEPKDAAMVMAWQRQRENIALYAEQVERAAKKSHEMTEGFSKGLEEVGNKLLGGYVGFNLLEKGIDKLIEKYKEWLDQLDEVANKQQKIKTSLDQQLALRGKLHEAPEVERGLERIKSATPDEARAAFAAISNAAPGLSAAQQVALAQRTAPMAGYLGDEGMRQVAGLAGSLAGTAPGRHAAEMAGLALLSTQAAAGRAGELADPASQKAREILTKGGMSIERATSFETEALGKVLSSRDINNLAVKLTEPLQARPVHQKTAELDFAFNRFADAKGMEERLKLLQTDAAVRASVLGEKAQAFGVMDLAGADARALDWTKREGTEPARQELKNSEIDRRGWHKRWTEIQTERAKEINAGRAGWGDLQQQEADEARMIEESGGGPFAKTMLGIYQGVRRFHKADTAPGPEGGSTLNEKEHGEKNEHAALQRETNGLLRKLVEKPQTIVANIQPSATGPPRIQATERPEPSPSLALSHH